MKAQFAKSTATLAIAVLSMAMARAQTSDWDLQCIDPLTTNPYSPDFALEFVANDLFGATAGVSGRVTYGDAGNPDDDIPCFTGTHDMQTPGRLSFGVGAVGSIQDQYPADPSSNFVDDFMALTGGYPDACGTFGFAMTSVDGTRTQFGENGITLAYTGSSNRYFVLESTNDNIFVHLQVSVIGDAAAVAWTFTNTDTEAHNVGLWFGEKIGMLTNFASTTDINGANASSIPGLQTPTNEFRSHKPVYAYTGTERPPLVGHRYVRTTDPTTFPPYVAYYFGQTAAYGIRVENGPSESTTDPITNQSPATEVAEFVFGDEFFLMGLDWNDPATMPDAIIPDNIVTSSAGFIQKFPETPMPGNSTGTKTITHFVRSTWGLSNYVKPYSIVVDAPKLVAVDGSGGAGSQNGLRPNPMVLRVYIDNFNYAVVNQEIRLEDVRIKVTLPPGISFVNNEPDTQIITAVDPVQVKFVDFNIESDGNIFGNLPFSVRVTDAITQTPRTLNGTITVATTPKLNLISGANLITLPWTFNDNSWEAVLGGLSIPQDFQAYKWDAQQQGYVVSTGPQRGVGQWIVATNNFPYYPLSSNPTMPGDTSSGFVQINLKSGWNLIANPYPYPVPLGQLVGVTASNPQDSLKWSELVQQGIVNGALASYDPNTGDYVFIEGVETLIQPNTGYWVFVGTLQDVTINYPAVFIPGLPGSFRSINDKWVQSDQHWRLVLSARTNKSLDGQNYIGRVKTPAEVKANTIMEPPKTPVHDVQVSIEEVIDGKIRRLAQGVTSSTARKSWKVVVTTEDATTVNLTWPNLATVPKNMQFRITDTTSGESRNLRQTSGYSFSTSGPTTRTFTLDVTSGKPAPAIIGNVVVSGGTRGGGPMAINYTLSSEATTTVRILSSAGKEIFTAKRAAPDRTGENSATWPLRDNANRVVAPGSYRAEIIVETVNGERVRRVVPLNVVR